MLVNQFGFLIRYLSFFNEIEDPACWWRMVQHLTKITYEKDDKVYEDGGFSDEIYFIHQGGIKLYGDFGYPFASFKEGQTVGETDVFSGMKRNGTAICFTDCKLYKVFKSHVYSVLQDFPSIKANIIK